MTLLDMNSVKSDFSILCYGQDDCCNDWSYIRVKRTFLMTVYHTHDVSPVLDLPKCVSSSKRLCDCQMAVGAQEIKRMKNIKWRFKSK
jgi:hypothetical protein